MKLPVLLIFCLLFSGMVNAQFKTGQNLISGQLNFSDTHYDATNSPGSDQRNTYGGISFSISRFKSPLYLLGFGVQYGYSDARYNSGSSPYENKNNFLGAFIELIKLQPVAKKLYLAFSGLGGMNYSISDSYYTNNTRMQTKGFNVYVNGGMGIWYQLTSRFLLTGNVSNLLAVSYGNGKTTSYLVNNTSVVEGTNTTLAITTGLSNFSLANFGFGVKYLLK